ncbi:hypothetical protein L7E55_05235 [Pelotomaculum isophthalicicum JI]|uniref:Uncharacterized protein n=1 Tax=Pelotomaculum isophthalicicum JI TaxID=947010 RepID=A0A9X4JV68_9FIRM|nr:hypothetical protein [Pelotomaculum isophthalicicum]MDF9407766.1 hypothetical protein [Pelotomaculum isophthalicicum JI]
MLLDRNDEEREKIKKEWKNAPKAIKFGKDDWSDYKDDEKIFNEKYQKEIIE